MSSGEQQQQQLVMATLGDAKVPILDQSIPARAYVDERERVWLALTDLRNFAHLTDQLNLCYVTSLEQQTPSSTTTYILDSDVIRLLSRHQAPAEATAFLHWLVPHIFIRLLYQHKLTAAMTLQQRLTLRRDACQVYANIIKRINLE